MKWHRPQDGDERTLRRFALLPVWDDDDIYWLEWVTIYQSYDNLFHKPGKWVTHQVIGDSDNGSEDNTRNDREGSEVG